MKATYVPTMNISHSLKVIWEGFTSENKPELAIGGQVVFREDDYQEGKFTDRKERAKKKGENGISITCHRVR